MAQGLSVLRLFLLEDRRVDLDRASILVARLGARRSVSGELPEWFVVYDTDDVSAAMRACAADLEGLDPRWPEIFDFNAMKRRWWGVETPRGR